MLGIYSQNIKFIINSMNNISFAVSNLLCTACGVCEDVCPKHAITIKHVNGEYRPKLDIDLCLGDRCGRCLKVCPGIGIDLVHMAESFFSENIKVDKYIGRYTTLYTGHSTDEYIRLHAASGGMVSQFLIFLLEKDYIDGAVVTKFSDEDHLTPVSYIARTREEILDAKSSKYCPVSLNKVGNEIARSEGRYAIVGLPCHIQGFRKRAKIDKKFSEHVVGYFAIYCSSNRTFHAQEYLLRAYQVDSKKLTYFAYRDNGCQGNLTIEQCGKERISIPYVRYYGRMLKSFFKPHRCLTCIDHYGELADVCFGDISIMPYLRDQIGISSWIVRNSNYDKLFQQAQREGYITMKPLEPEILNRSQATMLYPKKRKAKAVMRMDKLLGRAIPQYDKRLDNPGIKDYVSEIICHVQRFIGRHKRLWLIIDMLNKGK